MLKSARIRSHYLLYLHEVIRNNLIEKGLLDQLYTQCREFCQASTAANAALHGESSLIDGWDVHRSPPLSKSESSGYLMRKKRKP